MAGEGQATTERWGSRVGLVLAMAGNAVGLGNFLRFPAQAMQNGGGAFLIPYFVVLLLIGLPLVWIEWSIGRYGGKHGHHSTPGAFDAMGKSPYWKYLGVFGLWNCLLIAAFYLYIESWCLAYTGYSLVNGFKTTNPEKFLSETIQGQYPNQILAATNLGMGIFAVCVCINIYILSRGLAKGIEIVSKIGMPMLIFFAAILAIRGLLIDPETDPKAVASPFVGLNYVWEPKFDSLTDPKVWLAAAGQIFFTISIGMGSMQCYASYVREKDDIVLNGTTSAWTNEFVEVVLGGTILIPIAVAYLGLEKVKSLSGFGLGFIVFPELFRNWGALAPVAGFLWFGLLFFAAITSSLAMGQPMLAFLQDEFKLTRKQSALVFGGMLLPLAIPVAMLHSSSFFDEFDFWAGTFSLVVMAVAESVLFCWVFGMPKGWEEMNRGAELKVPKVFYYVMQYVTPTFLIIMLVAYIFEPAAGWKTYLAGTADGSPIPAWEFSSGSMMGKLMHKDLPLPKDASEHEITFNSQLKFMRTVDRGVMVASFLGLAALVSVAWARRRRTGENQQS
ncbi:sodium:calcium symporter [bacterium]|nr:sodium:calcium symporter [bacterium]